MPQTVRAVPVDHQYYGSRVYGVYQLWELPTAHAADWPNVRTSEPILSADCFSVRIL